MLMPARDEAANAPPGLPFAPNLQFGGDPLERIRKSFPDVHHLIYETCGAIDTNAACAVFPNLVSLVVYPGNGQGPTEGISQPSISFATLSCDALKGLVPPPATF